MPKTEHHYGLDELSDLRIALYIAQKALEAVQREQDGEGSCLFCRPESEDKERLVAGHIQECPQPLIRQAIGIIDTLPWELFGEEPMQSRSAT